MEILPILALLIAAANAGAFVLLAFYKAPFSALVFIALCWVAAIAAILVGPL